MHGDLLKRGDYPSPVQYRAIVVGTECIHEIGISLGVAHGHTIIGVGVSLLSRYRKHKKGARAGHLETQGPTAHDGATAVVAGETAAVANELELTWMMVMIENEPNDIYGEKGWRSHKNRQADLECLSMDLLPEGVPSDTVLRCESSPP